MKQEIIDIAGLSYPDKRDCGVSQRAKTNTNFTNETNEVNPRRYCARIVDNIMFHN